MNTSVLLVGLLLLVGVVYFASSGVGVYPALGQPITPIITSITTTSGLVTYTYTTTSWSQSGVSNPVDTSTDCQAHGICQPSVHIYPNTSPITSAEDYCNRYEDYYGTTNCPVSGYSSSGVYGASLLAAQTEADLRNIQLVDLSLLTGNPLAPYIDLRLAIGLIASVILIALYLKKR